jgi:phosphoglycerol transferase MdoB-like AlkP superfamily enzyme
LFLDIYYRIIISVISIRLKIIQFHWNTQKMYKKWWVYPDEDCSLLIVICTFLISIAMLLFFNFKHKRSTLHSMVWAVLLIFLLFCVVCVSFVFVLLLVCPTLPMSLDCPFLIAPFVFSNIYFIGVNVFPNFRFLNDAVFVSGSDSNIF